MTDKIISIVALAGFGLFLGVLAWWVRHPDLLIVLAIGFGLCAYDFWQTLWSKRDGD
ncbi:MAG TPA: hypothetical protein VFJ13_10155 [Paracoccaceae bacterium]|nr:hypothetical protein [Paracoccaceae bacterium]